MSCTRSLQLAMTCYVTAGYFLVVVLLTFAFYLLIRLRKTFHPFFLMFFLPFVFFYILCLSCYIIIDFCRFFNLNHSHPLLSWTNFIVIVTYRSNTPLIIFFLLERLYATKYCGTYENERPWHIFVPLLPLTLFLALLDLYLLNKEIIPANIEQYSLLGLEIVIFLLLCILHMVNKRLVVQWTFAGVGLSSRYQLSENIRALRLIIPVIVWDGAITTEDMLAQIHFKINHEFDILRCRNEPNYVFLFIFLDTLALSLISCVPLSILLAHPAIRQMAKHCLHLGDKLEKRKKLINVLGDDIKQTGTADEHFKSLFNMWNHRDAV